MVDDRITDYAALTGANLATGDLFEVVDVSDTSLAATGTNKKMTAAELLNGMSALGGVQVVNHGSTAGTSRPSGAVQIFWIGSVAPTNGVAGDQWRDTTLNATRYNVGGVWFYPPGLELGYAERTTDDTTTNATFASAAANLIGGLSVTVVGTGQSVDVESFFPGNRHSTVTSNVYAQLVINSSVTGAQVALVDSPETGRGRSVILKRRLVLTAGTSYTFEIGKAITGTGTGTYTGSTNNPMHLTVTSR